MKLQFLTDGTLVSSSEAYSGFLLMLYIMNGTSLYPYAMTSGWKIQICK